jgi:hypothetical protein
MKHGGLTPKGIASPHYKDGRKSLYLRHLPRQMAGAYKAALADPDYTCLRGELALQTARLDDLLAQLAREEGPAWTTLVLALDILQLARTKGEVIDAALATLDHLIRSGAACARTRTELWSEVRALVVEKARVSAAESKRLADLSGTVTVEQALLWARALLAAAREVVTDRDQLRRLQERALAFLPPAEDERPERRRPVVVDHEGSPPATGNGRPAAAPAPEPAPATLSPGGGDTETPAAPDPSPGLAGCRPAPSPPPSAPAPPAPGPVCGLKELPAGADPADWEWVDEGDGAAL